MDFKDLEQQIPQTEPDLQMGPLSIWITDKLVDKRRDTDYIYLDAPSLLKTERIVAFSRGSQIAIFDLKSLKSGLTDMHAHTGLEKIVDIQFTESEFGVKFTSNIQGQINLEIEYRSWRHDGQLFFEEKIDQSYLPEIIKSIDEIIKEYL